MMSLTESWFWRFFCGCFQAFWRKMAEKLLYNIWHIYSFGHISDGQGIMNRHKSICINLHYIYPLSNNHSFEFNHLTKKVLWILISLFICFIKLILAVHFTPFYFWFDPIFSYMYTKHLYMITYSLQMGHQYEQKYRML